VPDRLLTDCRHIHAASIRSSEPPAAPHNDDILAWIDGGAYRRIMVHPAVDFSSLEEVLVVVTPTVAADPADGVSE